jgi:hypothetical protein
MSIVYPGASDPADIIKCARRLADDIEQLVACGGPTAADLAGAPVIDLYRPAQRPATALIGVLVGHPTVSNRHVAMTTEIFAIDPDAGWARSWSRFYALGRPVELRDRRRQ